MIPAPNEAQPDLVARRNRLAQVANEVAHREDHLKSPEADADLARMLVSWCASISESILLRRRIRRRRTSGLSTRRLRLSASAKKII